MKINIGSKNKTKVASVTNAIAGYPKFAGAVITPIDVQVETFGHPKGLDNVVKGAMDRAVQAFKDCDYSFGLEGGLLQVPHSKTGYMEVAVCSIYDGQQHHLGMSSGYEWPRAVADGILNKGLDGSQAIKAAGLTTQEKIGTAEGGIFLLSDGKLNRTEYNTQAVITALVHLLHPEWY